MCVCVRTLTGLGMLVCSMDGTVAYLDFSLDELGDPLSEEEKVRLHASLFNEPLTSTRSSSHMYLSARPLSFTPHPS